MLDAMREGEAGVDQHRRAVRKGRAYCAAGSGKAQTGEAFPGVSVVQQRVCQLSGKVDVDVFDCFAHTLPREDAPNSERVPVIDGFMMSARAWRKLVSGSLPDHRRL